MQIRTYLQNRFFIILTIIYIAIILFADKTGYFNRQNIDFCISESVKIEGIVLTSPEYKDNKISFIVKTNNINEKSVNYKTIVNYYSAEKNIEEGDILLITGETKKPNSSKNPGAFDYEKYLLRQNIYFITYADSIETIGIQELPFFKAAAKKIKKNIIQTINTYLPEKEASILIPMLIGEKSQIDDDIKKDFIDAGLIHILVVSGMNVAYCWLIFFWFFRVFGITQKYASIFVIPFIILYIFITGTNPPVVRAGVMAICIIISFILKREPLIYQSLSIAAAIILIENPQALFSISFQLSFAATLGILYFFPYFDFAFSKFPYWFRFAIGNVLSVTLAAQIGIMPIIAYYFDKVSIIGLLSNLIVIPLTGIITTSGIILYFLHFISNNLAEYLGKFNYYLLHLLLYLVHYFSGFSWANIHLGIFSLFSIFVYYVIFWGIFQIKRNFKMVYFLAAIILLFGTISLIQYKNFLKQVQITFLNIGNGDAIHIRFNNGKNWLIDGGGEFNYNIGEKVLCPYLWHNNIKTLEKIVISHPHYHHYSGLKSVIENFKVNEIIFNPEISNEKEFVDLMKIINEKQIPWKEVWSGEKILEGESQINVLSPEILSTNIDDNSLVLSLLYGQMRVLFTSDMGENAEKYLLNTKINLKTNILQIPNHGNRHLSEKFMAAANPDVLIVSGKKFSKSNTYITAKKGAIKVVINKKSFKLIN